MTTKQADTNDNNFSGSGQENPFSQGQGAPQSVPTDAQMSNSQGFQGIGGGDLPAGNPMTTDQSDPNGSNPDQQAMQQTSAYHVGCLVCGNESVLPRVTAALRCRCGSANLVFEAYDWSAADDGVSEYYDFTPKTTGYVVSLAPQMAGFRWELDHNNDVVAKGSADSKAQAQAIVEANAPYYVGEQKAAAIHHGGWKKLADGKPPWLDKGKDGGDDKKPEEKKPEGGDDKSAPGDDKKPNPFGGDPDKQPPVAGDDQGAAAMDAAQKILDDAVANLATLGHDAKEIKYDVDALESEWRCVNCGLEGQANISDDGQTDLQGDLFQDQNPCASPANPDQDPADPAAAPGAPPVAAPPAAAPPNAAAPPPVTAKAAATHDPYAANRAFETNTTEAKSGTKVKCTVPGCGWETTRPGNRGGQLADLWTEHAKSVSKTANHDDLNNNRDELNARNSVGAPDDPDATEKISVIIEGILGSNPGMNEESARKIATLTVQRYPSVIGG